jgi:hypothetical protein
MHASIPTQPIYIPPLIRRSPIRLNNDPQPRLDKKPVANSKNNLQTEKNWTREEEKEEA